VYHRSALFGLAKAARSHKQRLGRFGVLRLELGENARTALTRRIEIVKGYWLIRLEFRATLAPVTSAKASAYD